MIPHGLCFVSFSFPFLFVGFFVIQSLLHISLIGIDGRHCDGYTEYRKLQLK